MKNFLNISVVLFVYSCISINTSISDIPNYAFGLENIKHNLDKNKIDFFEAYIEASKILNNSDTTSDVYKNTLGFLEELKNSIDNDAKKYFDSTNDVKDYENTIKNVLSLKVINAKSSVGLNDAYSKLLKYAEASSDIFTQDNIKEEMADLLLTSNQAVYDLLKKYSTRNKGLFLYYFNKYTKIYPNLMKEFPDLKDIKENIYKNNSLNIEEIMKSVVAVILNKGINIKDGMGYLDKSLGTGFFVDDKGHILTNYHVIADHVDPEYKGYSAVYVTTKDDPDTEIPAKVIGYDKVFDIALLQITKTNKDYLAIGRSPELSLGDKIYSIGNPIGIKYTVTSGIVSNKDIDFFQLGRALQVDAAINPGNSGGPLINDKGEVIGIVFAGIPQFEGINFAIPFEWVRKTMPDLYKGGEVKRCWIGSGIYSENNKIYFYYILPNGAASKAGIKVGDALLKVDGVEVKTVEDAQGVLAWARYPRLMEIEIERNKNIIKKIVRLEERPYIPIEEAFKRDTEGNLLRLIFGISVEYYNKGLMFKKYKTIKVYKGMYGFQLNINDGDPIIVYELTYMQKQKIVKLTIQFKQKDVGVMDRIITVASPVEINTIL